MTNPSSIGLRSPKVTDLIRDGAGDISTNAQVLADLHTANVARIQDLESRSGTFEAAAAALGDYGQVVTTTVTDHNLLPYSRPHLGGWDVFNASVSTFSTGTDHVSSTAIAAGTGTTYHAVRTPTRPPFPVGQYGTVWITAEVRATTATQAVIWLAMLTGDTSAGTAGYEARHDVGPSWRRITQVVTIPAAVDNYRINVAAWAPYEAGDKLDVRNVGIITSDGGWFDGSTTDSTSASEDRTHSWDGDPGASTSTRTVTTRTSTGGGLGGRTVIDAILALEEGGGGGQASGVVVAPPPAFTLRRSTLPTIQRDGLGYRTTIDDIITALRPPTGATYYVSPTGGGTGATAASPLTLEDARAKADVGTIIFAPGEYNRVHARVPGRTGKSINYIAAGPGVVLSGWSQQLPWTHTAGNVYQTTRTGTESVADPRPQYWVDGVIRMYRKAGTTAASVTEAGTWATDGTTVWVWAFGDTDLATNPGTLRLGLAVDVGIMHNGGTAYVEGITVEGAGAGRGMDMLNGTLIMVDCVTQGAAANGVTAVDALVVAVRCDASANGQDGFNYHESSGQCDFIEVDCTARRNGWSDNFTHNGSTAHESCRGVRVGGRYADTWGPILADVGTSQTWTLGARTERIDTGMGIPVNRDGHYHADGAGATMWVQDADITGYGIAWRASLGGTIATRTPRRVAATTVASLTDGGTLTRY